MPDLNTSLYPELRDGASSHFIHRGYPMKPRNDLIRPAFAVLVAILVVSNPHLQGQNKSTLEQRVDSLERKVKALERRIFMMLGGKAGEVQRMSVTIQQEMSSISISARQYLGRPGSMNGGGGSYLGFTLSPKMAQGDYASYSVTPGDTDLVIEGQATFLTGKIRVNVGIDGRLRNWTYTGDFANVRGTGMPGSYSAMGNLDALGSEVSSIASHAYQYRNRPRGSGGNGSFAGYDLPKEMSSTAVGWYAVTVTDSGLVIEARHKKTNVVYEALVDSTGRMPRTKTSYAGEMKKPVNGPKTVLDSVREFIANDFANIAARAYQYKTMPAPAGGGGKYTGYLSAQTASIDGSANYDFLVDPDAVLVRARATRVKGSVSAKVDANGRLSGWYYTGDLAQ